MKKKVKWARYYFNNPPKEGDRKMKWADGFLGKIRFIYQVLYGLILIPALFVSLIMLFQLEEKAWALHAPMIFSTTVAYIWAFIKRK
jgi:hypothetical protein